MPLFRELSSNKGDPSLGLSNRYSGHSKNKSFCCFTSKVADYLNFHSVFCKELSDVAFFETSMQIILRI